MPTHLDPPLFRLVDLVPTEETSRVIEDLFTTFACAAVQAALIHDWLDVRFGPDTRPTT